MSIRPNKRTYAIGLFLLTGWTPWGVDLDYGDPSRRAVPLCGRKWIMCCGHVMSQREAQAWLDAGLAVEGLDGRGRRALLAGPKLARWISDSFDNLRARSWVRK